MVMTHTDKVNKLRAQAARLGYAIQKIPNHPASQRKQVPEFWSTPADLPPNIPDKKLRDCLFSKAFLGAAIVNPLARNGIMTRHDLLKVGIPGDLLEIEFLGPKSIDSIDKWRTEVITDCPFTES
jgi:hypothetical protein